MPPAGVLFLAVQASVHLFLLVGQEEYMGQFLFDGGDTAGIFAFDDVGQLLGKHQLFLIRDPAAADDVDGDAGIHEAQYVKVDQVDADFDLNDILFAHLVAAAVFDDGNLAVELAKSQVVVDIHAFAGRDMIQYKTFS